MSQSLRWYVLVLGLAVPAAGLAAQDLSARSSPATSLDGAWRMISRSWTVADSTFLPTAHYSQPGLLIIVGNYYSSMYSFTDTPRRLLPTDRQPTDAELAHAFGTFSATAGRLTRTDTTLTMFTDVAKNPNNMARVSSFTENWRLKGDTLWLENQNQVSSADPATARRVLRRTTYVRAR